jgi:hypothetical protein
MVFGVVMPPAAKVVPDILKVCIIIIIFFFRGHHLTLEE